MNNEKNLGGRPAKYKDEYVQMAREYFSKPEWDEEYKLWKFPSRVFFAKKVGVALNTVKGWEKQYEDFGNVMAEGIENSKELRIAFAENEKINPAFAKYVLSSAYNMTEKSALDIGNADNKPFEVNITVVRK